MNPEEILHELKIEREKFTQSDDSKMQNLIDQLIELGVYPKSTVVMERQGYTHLHMVQSYGEDWHIWSEPTKCPNCEHDLRNLELGPPFQLQIAWYVNDMTIAWVCPFCRTAFNRLGLDVPDLYLSEEQLEKITKSYRELEDKNNENQ